MFTITKPVIKIDGTIDNLRAFDDVKDQQNVLFALNSTNPHVIKHYYRVASQYKERFYFFQF